LDDTTFIEYLKLKKTLDDRSLNRNVWETLVSAMPKAERERPWRVLEIGAGIGTMIQRLIEWDFLHFASYLALDASSAFLAEARHRLSDWAIQNGFDFHTDESGLLINDAFHEIKIQFVAQEVDEWLAAINPCPKTDLVIAHAFLDLINLETTLPLILSCLRKGGLFYFTINFDGLTVIEPPVNEPLDELILSLYHRTMEERVVEGRPTAGAYCGRRLLCALQKAGSSLLRAGASDWVIHPVEGNYLPGEDRFLRFLLQMVEESLRERSEIEPDQLQEWLKHRLQQIEQGELSLIVHQLDFVGRRI
jgi:SAM-dependent methyltransferase